MFLSKEKSQTLRSLVLSSQLPNMCAATISLTYRLSAINDINAETDVPQLVSEIKDSISVSKNQSCFVTVLGLK